MGKKRRRGGREGREEEDFKGGMRGLGTGRQFCRISFRARPDLAWPDGMTLVAPSFSLDFLVEDNLN